MYTDLFLSQGPQIVCKFILFFVFFFQVNDTYDTAPTFNKSLFAAGININDKTDSEVTTLVVSIKHYLTLRTEVTYRRNFNKGTFVGHDSNYNSVISIYFLLRYNLVNRRIKAIMIS